MARTILGRTVMATYNMLSLDGGGSKGVMEAVMLQDVMACIDLVQMGEVDFKDESHKFLGFETAESRKVMRDQLDDRIKNDAPVHPGQIFKMVAGTSTGALMAFGLIHGNNRGRMKLKDVIEMYKIEAATIFPTSWGNRLFGKARIPWSGDLPVSPYYQDGLKSVLDKKFGTHTLGEVKTEEEDTVVAAVARRHNHPLLPDRLEIFDTKQESSHSLVDVLKASACAPVYFQTPAKIGDTDYIDGGVGGNCPLAQAIPRMAELAGKDDKLQAVLSLAPPSEARKEGSKNLFYWLQWFASEFTGGRAVYYDQERTYPDTIFLRLTPKSDATRAFKLDSLDVEGMVDSVRLESLQEPAYFMNILLAALVLAPTGLLAGKTDSYRQLSKEVERYYKKTAKYSKMFKVIRARLALTEKYHGENSIEASTDQSSLASCYHYMARYKEALEAAQKSICFNPDDTNAINILGLVYRDLSLSDQAIEEHKHCLNVMRDVQKLTSNHPDVADQLVHLGSCYAKGGQYDQAIEKFVEALEMYKKLQLEDPNDSDIIDISRGIARCQRHLGICYLRKKQYSVAIETVEESLKEMKEIHVDMLDHLDIAICQSSLGILYMSNGQYVQAIEKHEEALRIKEEIYRDEPDHPEIALSLQNLGACYAKTGQYAQAIEKAEKSLDIYRKVYKDQEDNAVIAVSLLDLGKIHMVDGHKNKALPMIEKSLRILNKLYEDQPDHPYLKAVREADRQLRNPGSNWDSLPEDGWGV